MIFVHRSILKRLVYYTQEDNKFCCLVVVEEAEVKVKLMLKLMYCVGMQGVVVVVV